MAPSPVNEIASPQEAENSDVVELSNGNRTFCTPQFPEGQNASNINPSVLKPGNPNFEYQNSNVEISKIPNSAITNNVINGAQTRKELFLSDNVPRELNVGNQNVSSENYLLNKPVNGYHNALQNPHHPDNFASNNPATLNGYSRDFPPSKFPGENFPRVQNSEVLNGRVNGCHETNLGLRKTNLGNSTTEQERIFNQTEVKQSEAHDFLSKFMNGKNYPEFVNRWGNVTHGYNGIPLYPGFAINGFHANVITNGLPKNGYHNGLVRQESNENRGENFVASEKCDLDRDNSENHRKNENISTNSSEDDVRWIDSSMGGVGLALSHGSILIECAKQEVHATTRINKPNRKEPTRISIVFYQHRLMNFKNHGYEEYRKHMEQKAAQKAALNADGELSFDAFDLRMLADTAVNYPSPAEQGMVDRNVGNYPPGIPSLVHGTAGKYPQLGPFLLNKNAGSYPERAPLVNGKVDNHLTTSDSYPGRPPLANQIASTSRIIQTNGESTASITTHSTPRSMQYPPPQTNGIGKPHQNGSVMSNHHSSFPLSEYLRSLKHKEYTNFRYPYPTYPFANALSLTPFIPPIFLPPPRHPSAMFNPFTPAGRESYHVVDSQYQSGPPIHEINTKRSQNTYQNLLRFENGSAIPKPLLNSQQRPPTHDAVKSSDSNSSQNANPNTSSHEIKSNFDPKPSRNTNDYSVEALLGRKRPYHNHVEISSDTTTENHPLKQRRLDQNGLSYLNSFFNKQQDIHTRLLGLPLHPDLAVDRTTFPSLPYPTKSIFTGTTTYATDSLVNMAPFAGTLVGGGHYQW